MATAKKTLSPQEKLVAAAKRKEAKKERFLKLAAKRVNRALAAIENVARLANKNSYEYTSDQAQKIVKAIETKGLDMARRFTTPNAAAASEFTL